jgi:hypothetical protein
VEGSQTFRSPFAALIWWVWVLFALANLIDLAVQGRDHLSVVAAFTLVLITGVVYTTTQRPRIVADDGGLTIANPLRDHRIGWAAVTQVDATELLRVRCEWPLAGAAEDIGAAGDSGAADPAGSPGRRVIYSWAVHSSRRRQLTAQLRTERPRLRPRSPAVPSRSFGAPPAGAAGGQPPTAADTERIVAALSARAEQAQAANPRPHARPPASTWCWPALAVIVIPALALVVAIVA